ncbi:MAG TPA: serine hydrolase domain-containing protein, partial [Kribbella sp.]|uniref:serine hydrolase domain-containing protein n=1 Tax=Kribbella sp. TaxID=1871183 RepID=UPI002D780A61
CVLLQVERGLVNLDRPLAFYWPEFAAAGKGAITVAEVLSHQARLPGADFSQVDILDHDAVASLLAAQAPAEDPRAAFMYHAITWGWLVDELVRRTDGRPLGLFFAEEFAQPLDLEVWIGLPSELHAKASTMVAADGVLADAEETDPLRQLTRNPLLVPGAEKIWNSPGYRGAGLAAVGGFATARGMARFYASLLGEVDGVRVLKPEIVDRGRRELRRGIEPLWGSEMAYAAGFELHTSAANLGAPANAFGHAGAGGSRHGAWPEQGLAFSYLMNEVRLGPDPRPLTLLDALNQAGQDPEGGSK